MAMYKIKAVFDYRFDPPGPDEEREFAVAVFEDGEDHSFWVGPKYSSMEEASQYANLARGIADFLNNSVGRVDWLLVESLLLEAKSGFRVMIWTSQHVQTSLSVMCGVDITPRQAKEALQLARTVYIHEWAEAVFKAAIEPAARQVVSPQAQEDEV